MKIPIKNTRQMPKAQAVISQKDYCDLLYAWLQCNSDRIDFTSNQSGRKILKSKIKFVAIEKEFTQIDPETNKPIKLFSRKTISKYFSHLISIGLVYEEERDPDYYYLKLLEPKEGNLIEYNTLSKLITVLQKNSLNIYIYLYNRYYANNFQPFIATMKQIKEYIGIATTTTSNNYIILNTIDILSRLGLLKMSIIFDDNKTYMQFSNIRNSLPEH